MVNTKWRLRLRAVPTQPAKQVPDPTDAPRPHLQDSSRIPTAATKFQIWAAGGLSYAFSGTKRQREQGTDSPEIESRPEGVREALTDLHNGADQIIIAKKGSTPLLAVPLPLLQMLIGRVPLESALKRRRTEAGHGRTNTRNTAFDIVGMVSMKAELGNKLNRFRWV